jgi:putative tryptophan/tyrosine transport system substrate-binding protein
MFRYLRRICAAIVLVPYWGLAVAAQVEIILSEEGPAYSEAAAAIRQELGPRVTIATHLAAAIEADRSPVANASVLIALGTRALSTTLNATVAIPVIAGLVPRVAFERLAIPPGNRPVSAVYLDQPALRQIRLFQVLLPGKTRLGVVSSRESEATAQSFSAAAREARLALVHDTASNERELFAALVRVLAESDALMALPDATLYNTTTIQNILTTAYRTQRPVLGFSAAYVRAGALAAVFSTPQQSGTQLAEAARQFLANAKLPAPQHPRAFSVAVNTTVARSLGLVIDSEAALVAAILARERTP